MWEHITCETHRFAEFSERYQGLSRLVDGTSEDLMELLLENIIDCVQRQL